MPTADGETQTNSLYEANDKCSAPMPDQFALKNLKDPVEGQQRAIPQTFSLSWNKPSFRKVESSVRNFNDAGLDCSDHEDNT
ncbi:hypothetical protein [Brevibacterium aurantiacum]|uniref:Uncharacterized protein n=1 Tax=Brevibacterium aurantiacum TaxID=273384 RepID=A0A556CRB5_BREAU|nr:hypothetical protein [Brevibacterium aurantiacum]TSI19698.1 hypothetical protein FO013_01765 [Brevibacterium aurantiacum]